MLRTCTHMLGWLGWEGSSKYQLYAYNSAAADNYDSRCSSSSSSSKRAEPKRNSWAERLVDTITMHTVGHGAIRTSIKWNLIVWGTGTWTHSPTKLWESNMMWKLRESKASVPAEILGDSSIVKYLTLGILMWNIWGVKSKPAVNIKRIYRD